MPRPSRNYPFLVNYRHVPGKCSIWPFGLDTDGYGSVWVPSVGCRKAHRVSWELHHGPVPAGLLVLHHCDTPPCFNHHCLFLGTHKVNAEDRDFKGRTGITAGEAHGMHKLTEEDVRAIRQSGDSFNALAQVYRVTPHAVWMAKTSRTWKHLT